MTNQVVAGKGGGAGGGGKGGAYGSGTRMDRQGTPGTPEVEAVVFKPEKSKHCTRWFWKWYCNSSLSNRINNQMQKATGGAISFYNGKTIHTFTRIRHFCQ